VTQFYVIISTFLCIMSALLADPYLKEGKEFGKKHAKEAYELIGSLDTDDWIPADQKGKEFDPIEAQQRVKEQNIPASEAQHFLSHEVQQNEMHNRGFDEQELFILRAEEISQNPEHFAKDVIEEQIIESQMEKCIQGDTPYPLSLIRTLEIEIVSQPAEIAEVKVCQGHRVEETYYLKENAKDAKRKWQKKLSSDPAIREFHIQDLYKSKGWINDYSIAVEWKHHDNTQACNIYQPHKNVIKEAHEELRDHWIYADEKHLNSANSPDCTHIETSCLDDTPTKTIQGKQVTRKCWKEKLTFFCSYPEKNPCAVFKARNCELVTKKCLLEGPFGCSLWELLYKCPTKIVKKQQATNHSDLLGEDEESWEVSYEPNHSFSDVTTKLAVFSEIKKEMEHSPLNSNIKEISLFSGQKRQCSKNVADHLLYDCCFKYGGLAKEAGLTKCTADELVLGEMREKGLCYYVGHYDEKFIDLWKSRKVHVFCCYGSKLARVVQEGIRAQIGIKWGDPEKPNCRGLTLDEIAKADFNKLDLSPIFDGKEIKLPENFQEKLEAFKGRIQGDIQGRINAGKN
jgi:conjugal transfer mating pair stabilization protein TraN